MNKYQELLENIKQLLTIFGRECGVNDTNLLQELVNKETPKKIKHFGFRPIENGLNICPICGLELGGYRLLDYCPSCGQKLDWSDVK